MFVNAKTIDDDTKVRVQGLRYAWFRTSVLRVQMEETEILHDEFRNPESPDSKP